MSRTRSVTIVHPDVHVRITLRTILEQHACTVSTDHSLRDLAATVREIRPDVILVDRTLLAHEGLEMLSELSRKWDEAVIVYLPEVLTADQAVTSAAPLLGVVDRMLQMKPTRDILTV